MPAPWCSNLSAPPPGQARQTNAALFKGARRIPAIKPTIVQGSWSGTGAAQTITLGFEPDLLLVKPSNGLAWFWHRYCWHYRAPTLGVAQPHTLRVTETSTTGFTVNSSASGSGATYHYLAIRDNGSGLLAFGSYAGDGVAGRKLDLPLTPVFLGVKRDNYYGFWTRRSDGSTAYDWDAVASAAHVASLESDGFTVDASEDTNKVVTSAGAGGEGYDYFALASSALWSLPSFTGTGAAQDVATSFDPVFEVLKNTDDTTPKAAFVGSASMGAYSGSVLGVSIAAGGVDEGVSKLTVDTTAAVNESGKTITALAFASAPAIVSPSVPNSRVALNIDTTSSGVIVPRNSAFDFLGVPFSLEMACTATTWPTVDGHFFSHGANSTQILWTLWQKANYNGTVNFNDWYDDGSTNGVGKWLNTGISLRPGRATHLVFSDDGSGLLKLWVDGILAKQMHTPHVIRQIPTANVANLRVGFGCRGASGVPTAGNAGMKIGLARIYGSVLSHAQVLTRYEKAMFGATADVTPLEEWDMAHVSGSVLAATGSSTNNGTITSCTATTM